MSAIGRLWLANRGNLYKTVSYEDSGYEEWKITTFSLQESGIISTIQIGIRH